MAKAELLRQITFGQRVAEEEIAHLATYFVETDYWQRLYRGDIDVVYGAKGAGKSALYSLLISKSQELMDRNIVLVIGENPQGATAFRDVASQPPATEREFIGLWKLYIVSLCHSALEERGARGKAFNSLTAALAREGLLRGNMKLPALLQTAMRYARRWFQGGGLESGIQLDPVTQVPVGFTGKIVFAEPGATRDLEIHTVDGLLDLVNQAFQDAGLKCWLLLDRLDVAFAEYPDLEKNALRALFRVYLDLLGQANVTLKIFLRTDIWSRLTEEGFREASHITRHMTITWSANSLLNLIVRRALYNDVLRQYYGVAVDLARQNVEQQEDFFYRMVPRQVEVGPNKPKTLEWMLTRTRDGTKSNAPRELIHFLNSLREQQAKRLEIGEEDPECEQLFSRPAFKEALPDVSKFRLEQTLFAEYPKSRGLRS